MEDWDALASLLEGVGCRIAQRDRAAATLMQASAAAVRAQRALRLGDAADARRRLAQAERLLDRDARADDDARHLRAWLAQLHAQASAVEATAAGSWALTSAELRILRLLPTHLSYPDIARQLYVSPNTVKTHARAVYRKLDASSRSEAVLHARDAGLLRVVQPHPTEEDPWPRSTAA